MLSSVTPYCRSHMSHASQLKGGLFTWKLPIQSSFVIPSCTRSYFLHLPWERLETCILEISVTKMTFIVPHYYPKHENKKRVCLDQRSLHMKNLPSMIFITEVDFHKRWYCRWARWLATSGTCQTTWTPPSTGRTRPWTESTPRPTATLRGSRWLTSGRRRWWNKKSVDTVFMENLCRI